MEYIIPESGGIMNVATLVQKYDLRVFTVNAELDTEIAGGYVSDLLSDVMGNARENQVWITLQTHQNVAAIASLKDLAAVIIVKELEPDKDTLEYCEREKIPLLGTAMSTFEMAGKLFYELNP